MKRVTPHSSYSPLLLAWLVAMPTGRLRAQDNALSLTDWIEVTVQQDSYGLLFTERGLNELPIAELVDALVPLRGRLPAFQWSRALEPVRSRRAAVEALWNDEQLRRRARAPVFAEVLTGWVERHQRARGAERGDIESVQRSLPAACWADDDGLDERARRASHEALQRVAAAAERERTTEVEVALRELEVNTPGAWLLQGLPGSPGVFALESTLGATDRIMRLRAVIALRARMQLEIPTWLSQHLRADDVLFRSVGPRLHLPRASADEGAFDRLLASLEANVEVVGWGHVEELDGARRRRLATALIAYALRVPMPEWDEVDARGLRARDHADARASGALAYAASLGAEEHAAVVALAAATPDANVTLRVLVALGGWSRVGLDFAQPMPRATAVRTEPILAALLDHADPRIVERAAVLCAVVVPAVPTSGLAESVVRRALTALQQPELLSARSRIIGGCGTGPWPDGLPDNRDSWLVFAACAAGDARLLAPLVAALRGHVDVAGKWVMKPESVANLEMLLLGATRLAPHVDAVGARQLHDLLAPTFVSTPRLDDDCGVHQRHVRRVLATVMPLLPKEVCAWHLTLPAHERRGLLAVMPHPERLDETLATGLIGVHDEHIWRAMKDMPEVFLAAPALLVEQWQKSGQVREVAEVALARMWVHDPDAVVALVIRGALPRAFAAVACDATRATLAQVAAVPPSNEDRDAHASMAASRFLWAIENARGVSVEQDLAALRVLASSPVLDIALTAARRLVKVGREAGGEARETAESFVRAVIERLVGATRSSDDLARVLQFAIESQLSIADLPPVLERLRAARSAQAVAIADAAAMCFLDQDPRRSDPGTVAHAIKLARLDIAADLLRELDAAASRTLSHGSSLGGYLHGCSPLTTRSALQLVAEADHWSGGMQKMVARCTVHDDPQVRLAAYRALATRDAALWPCALLVHEAVFDPDPAVQQFGREATPR